MGTAHFQTLLGAAQEFGKKVEPELRGQAPDEPLLVDLPIGLFSLTGQIESHLRRSDRPVPLCNSQTQRQAASLDQSSGPLRRKFRRSSTKHCSSAPMTIMKFSPLEDALSDHGKASGNLLART